MIVKRDSTKKTHRNKRVIYHMAIVITIVLGLASRTYSHLLVEFLAENAGDMLWAMMVYFGFRFLFIHKSLSAAISLSLLFSFGIECSQLYQEDWINQIRHTLLGSLILGQGFLMVDLVRYAAGILIASLMDKVILM
ncbi:DUF2809 domain-containing protein [Fictibacillus barbaricus]|uniref:Glycopeptide antibiotics resistance protein n=1 Tax=Fictibacillus barbaricus TaxID=182136 RepID=A0ABU1TWJ2_9BACL|nr:DUF2809 domain-containing protein [Fictibacillus barbaricus]MDR7071557.1 glycopeptide antibiotics resistance protein [Fictibacillus barbaricus]